MSWRASAMCVSRFRRWLVRRTAGSPSSTTGSLIVAARPKDPATRRPPSGPASSASPRCAPSTGGVEAPRDGVYRAPPAGADRSPEAGSALLGPAGGLMWRRVGRGSLRARPRSLPGSRRSRAGACSLSPTTPAKTPEAQPKRGRGHRPRRRRRRIAAPTARSEAAATASAPADNAGTSGRAGYGGTSNPRSAARK